MKKVVIGLSGGVDSSVAAYLLKQEGYQVEALFMKNWEGDDTDSYCAASDDLKDATQVAEKLGIKLHTINFAHEYWDNVFEYFLAEYKAGRTPNPDILCNKEIKFKCFLEYAVNNLNADYIATGHYASITTKEFNGHTQYLLTKACDQNKDQTYFLHALSEAQLSKSLFPLGNIEKSKVRAIAEELGLITHDKKDSTGICFIGERKFKDFLMNYIPAKPGDIIDENNNVIGKHDGLMYYTIGQRQGLNLGGLKNYSELPWYVAGKDMANNKLIAVQGTDHKLLYKNNIELINPHFINDNYKNIFETNNTLEITAKTRYRQADQQAVLKLDNSKVFIEFTEDQRAITPGQSVVFYKDNICLGGAIIK